MTEIKIKATNTYVSVLDKSAILTSGAINQIKCTFDLSEEYDNLTVRAVFNGKAVTVIDGECFAPELTEGRCIIGVYGYTVENGKTVLRISPKPCFEYIYKGSYNQNITESTVPSSSELEEYYSNIKKLLENIEFDADINFDINSCNPIANKTVTQALAQGKIESFFIISNNSDFENMIPAISDDEGNIVIEKDKYIIIMFTEDVDEFEKGIAVIDSNGEMSYLTKKTEDFLTYATKAYVNEKLNRNRFKKIYEATTEHEVNLILKSGLKLKEAFVVISGVRSSANTENHSAVLKVAANGGAITNCAAISSAYSVFNTTKDNVNYLHISAVGGFIKIQASYRYDVTSVRRPLNGCENILEGDYVTDVMMSSDDGTGVLGVGTKFEIWGIEADES